MPSEVIGGAIGAVGSVASGLIGSSAAKKAASAGTAAADQQAQVAREQLGMQWDMYNQSRADLYPWRTAGTSALNAMSGLMGLGYIPADTGARAYGQPAPVQQTNALAGYQPGAMTTAGGYQGNAPPASADEYLNMLMKDAEATGDVSKVNKYLADYKASVAGMTDEQGNPLYFTGQDPKGVWLQSYYDNFVGPYGGVQQQQGQLGQAATPTNALAGIPPAPTSAASTDPRAAEMARFQTSPGYEFRLGEGIKALERTAAAKGGLLGGAQIKAVQRYGEGLAASEYGDYWNRLAAMSGLGQTSSAQTGQLGASAASGMGGAYNALSNAYGNAGNARASGYTNQANALTGGISSGINNALFPYYMSQFGGGGVSSYNPWATTGNWSINTGGY